MRPTARKPAAAQDVLVRVFVVVAVSALFGGIIFHGTTIALPKIFQERLAGLVGDLATIGVLVAAVFTLAAFAQIAVGRLLDRYGARAILPLSSCRRFSFSCSRSRSPAGPCCCSPPP